MSKQIKGFKVLMGDYRKVEKLQEQQLTIYFDHKLKCSQVVRPTGKFNGDWKSLVSAICGIDEQQRPKCYKYFIQ